MIRHLIKLIWKQRKTNFLMMFEIFVSFLILFAVGSLGFYLFKNYNQPEGFSPERVWGLYCSFNSDTLREQNRQLVKQKLREYPEIETFSLVDGNMPYSFNSSNRYFVYQNNHTNSEYMRGEASMIEVLNLKLLEGRWLNETDKLNKNKPIVINRAFKEELFGDEDAVGKTIVTRNPSLNEEIKEEDKYQVIGVVENFKFEDEYSAIHSCLWTTTNEGTTDFLIKVKPGADINFEAKLTKDLVNLGTDWSMEVQHLEEMKTTKNKLILVPMLILLIVCGFLVFNVALGLFGVLFQTITRRKSEIGVRRAMGANKSNILFQFISETIIIATLGMILGLFFAIQFPLLNVFDVEAGIYIGGILIALVSIYLLVILCAMLPSRQAIQIYPALALHED